MAPLLPFAQEMDKFVTILQKEVEEESVAAHNSHKQRQAHLKDQEAEFLRGDASPRNNPIFAKLRSDLESIQDAEKQREKERASRTAFFEEWKTMLGKLSDSKPHAKNDVKQSIQPRERGSKILKKLPWFY